MSETPSPAPEPVEEEIEIPDPPKPLPPWLVWGGTFSGIVVAFGLITWGIGVGPFAYRTLYYGSAKLYILNMTPHTVTVSLDGGAGWELGPESAQHQSILGGTTRVVARAADGEIVDEFDVFVDGKPIFYNVGDAQCLVVSDASPFYLPGRERSVEIQQTYPEGTRTIELPHERAIWPRQTLRTQLEDPELGVPWIEPVACPLLDPQDRHILQAHLDILLVERKKHEQEREKQLEIQRRMMYGGGEAVDEMFRDAGKPGEKDAGPSAPNP